MGRFSGTLDIISRIFISLTHYVNAGNLFSQKTPTKGHCRKRPYFIAGKRRKQHELYGQPVPLLKKVIKVFLSFSGLTVTAVKMTSQLFTSVLLFEMHKRRFAEKVKPKSRNLSKWLPINKLTFLLNNLIAPCCNGLQNRDERFAKIG